MVQSIPAASITEYDKWVGRLYRTPLFYPSSPSDGRVRMEKLHGLLGNPMNNPDMAIIHIAGTNGKGSVALKLATTFQALGYPNVGLYTSPQVSCFRERIQWTNGRLITEEEVAQGLAKLYGLCRQHDIPATFFELITLLAFQFFQQRHKTSPPPPNKKTIIILETGLGGRWDATNVIEAPVLAIITSIGLDHTAILGNTHEKIALEKAGIMKPGCPVLVGNQVPHETLRQYAKQNLIVDYHTTEEVMISLDISIGNGKENNDKTNDIRCNNSDKKFDNNNNDLESDTVVDYDADNTRIVRAAISILQQRGALHLPSTIPEQLLLEATSARPPCRFETIHDKLLPSKPLVVMDVAHNPPAMRSLVYMLCKAYPDYRYRFVMGVSKDKDWRGILDALAPLTSNASRKDRGHVSSLSKVHLVQAANCKAVPLEQLVHEIDQGQTSQPTPIIDSAFLEYNLEDPSVTYQLRKAMDMAPTKNQKEIVVVCGSVFLMAEVRRVLGLREPCDSEYVMEIIRNGGTATTSPERDVVAFGNGEIVP